MMTNKILNYYQIIDIIKTKTVTSGNCLVIIYMYGFLSNPDRRRNFEEHTDKGYGELFFSKLSKISTIVSL